MAPAHADHLYLGNEGVCPPFSMANSTRRMINAGPGLAREMCKRMNAECEFMVMEFKPLSPSLIQGKFGIGGAQTKWLLEQFGDLSVPVYYNKPDEIHLDLLSKRIDLTSRPKINWTPQLIDKPEGKHWMLAGGDYWRGDPTLPPAERGRSWLIRKGDTALLAQANAALSSMMADCTLIQIRKQCIAFSLQPADAACTDKQA